MSIIRTVKQTILSNFNPSARPLVKETLADLLDKIDSDLNEVGYGTTECEMADNVDEALAKLDQVIAGTWTEEDELRLKTTESDEEDEDEEEDGEEEDGEEDLVDVEYSDEDLEDDSLDEGK